MSLKCVGAKYRLDQPIKRSINAFLASLLNALNNKSSHSGTDGDLWALVLDSELLLTCNELHESARVPYGRIVVPNPCPTILSAIRSKQPDVICLEMTTHELFRRLVSAEQQRQEEQAAKDTIPREMMGSVGLCYLDFNSSFGRIGFRTGKKRRDDIEHVFQLGLLSSPAAVLAVTFSLRGITESWENEHFQAAIRFIHEAASKGHKTFNLVAARRYSHSAAPMMFIAGVVTASNCPFDPTPFADIPLSVGTSVMGPSEKLESSASSPTAVESCVQPRKMSPIAEAIVPWVAANVSSIVEGASQSISAYVSAALCNPLGASIVLGLDECGWTVHTKERTGMSRPRNWWVENNHKELPPGEGSQEQQTSLRCIWMCDEGTVRFGKIGRKNRPCPIQKELVHLITVAVPLIVRTSCSPVCVCIHVSLSTLDERWKGEQRDRLAHLLRLSGGKILGAANYQGPMTSTLFVACMFGGSEHDFLPPPQVEGIQWITPSFSPAPCPIALHLAFDQRIAAHASIVAKSMGVKEKMMIVMDYPTAVWSKSIGAPAGSILLLRDPFEIELAMPVLEEKGWSATQWSEADPFIPAGVEAKAVGVAVAFFNSPLAAGPPVSILQSLLAACSEESAVLIILGFYQPPGSTIEEGTASSLSIIRSLIEPRHGRLIGTVRVNSSVTRIFSFIGIGGKSQVREEEDVESSWSSLRQNKKMSVFLD